MGSADFSQFVVTTANETVCETSTLKVHDSFLSPIRHIYSYFQQLLDFIVFWQTYPYFRALYVISVRRTREFAYSFLQIPPHDGHPCCSAIHFLVA